MRNLQSSMPMPTVVIVKQRPRIVCEHCHTTVSKNVYSRNHGDKCPYAGGPKGKKKCKNCGEYKYPDEFYASNNNTFDNRTSVCIECMNENRKAIGE